MKIASIKNKMDCSEVRAAVEISPQRRQALNAFFENRDDIESLNPGVEFTHNAQGHSKLGTEAPQ